MWAKTLCTYSAIYSNKSYKQYTKFSKEDNYLLMFTQWEWQKGKTEKLPNQGNSRSFQTLNPEIFKYTLFDLHIFSLTQIICKNSDLHNHYIAGARKWLH